MVHDLLLALLGFTGDIFVEDPDGQLILKSRYKIEVFDLAIVERVLSIGSSFTQLSRWVENTIGNRASSLYATALAVALQEEVLTVYTADIVELEKNILNASVGLTHIHLFLQQRWRDVLDALVDVLENTGENDEFPPHLIDAVINLAEDVSVRDDRGILQKLKVRVVKCYLREIEVWCGFGHAIQGGDISENRKRFPASLVDAKTFDKILFCGRARKLLGGQDAVQLKHDDAGRLDAQIEDIRQRISEQLYNSLVIEEKDNAINMFEFLKIIRKYVLLQSWDPFAGYQDIDRMSPSDVGLMILDGSQYPQEVFPITVIPAPESPRRWTLDIRIDSPVMELVVGGDIQVKQYRQIFDRLYSVMHARHVLNRSLKQVEFSPLANAVSQFLFSLSFYYQCDVIEPYFESFCEFARKCTDIQAIANKHTITMTKIQFELLLSIPSVNNLIDSILAIARDMGRTGNVSGLMIVDANVEFHTLIRRLIKELQSLQVGYNIGAVERLILKLDYNSFYRQSE